MLITIHSFERFILASDNWPRCWVAWYDDHRRYISAWWMPVAIIDRPQQ